MKFSNDCLDALPTASAEGVEQEESTAQFTPVVTLDEVDVQSGEEDEEIIYCQRGKLFIHGEALADFGSGNKEWNERGVGDIKILRHRETNEMRVLMREEETMKAIVNHALDPIIKLEPNVGSDRSWVWSAFDIVTTKEPVNTKFAIRFADSGIANAFKTIFEEQQSEMATVLAGADSSTFVVHGTATNPTSIFGGGQSVSFGGGDTTTTTTSNLPGPAVCVCGWKTSKFEKGPWKCGVCLVRNKDIAQGGDDDDDAVEAAELAALLEGLSTKKEEGTADGDDRRRSLHSHTKEEAGTTADDDGPRRSLRLSQRKK